MSYAVGQQGAFTFTGITGLGTTLHARVVRVRFPVRLIDNTDFYDRVGRFLVESAERAEVTLQTRLDMTATDAPALPEGTAGTLVATLLSGATWTIVAIITEIEYVRFSDGGEPQAINYTFTATASGLPGSDSVAAA